MLKAVRVLSIFDLKGGMSGSASRDIRTLLVILIDHGDWFMGLFFCRQKKCTGRHKNTWNAATQSWYCCHAFLGLKRTGSVLGTARLQHIFGLISFTLAGEKEPSWFRASSLYQSELGQHGRARLGTMLAHFGHVYTATANCAEPCWHSFKWQCKRSIRIRIYTKKKCK